VGRETPADGPPEFQAPGFLAVGSHLEVHGATQGTTNPEPIQSLPHWAIYLGGTIPIHARCVETPLTHHFFFPSFALTHFCPVEVLPTCTGHPQALFFPHPESDVCSRHGMW